MGRRRKNQGIAGGLLLLALLAAGCEAPGPARLRPGDPVPPVAFDGMDGRRYTLAALRGRTLVVNLWATWCPPCREEMPALERLSRDLAPEDFQVLGISFDEDANLVREFALAWRISFPLGMAPGGGEVKTRLQPPALPDTLIITPDGRLADRVLGHADWDAPALRARVAARGPSSGRTVWRRENHGRGRQGRGGQARGGQARGGQARGGQARGAQAPAAPDGRL